MNYNSLTYLEQKEALLIQWTQIMNDTEARMRRMKRMLDDDDRPMTPLTRRNLILAYNEQQDRHESARIQVGRIRAALRNQPVRREITSDDMSWWQSELRMEGGEG